MLQSTTTTPSVVFVKQSRTAPISVRLSPELNQRLEEVAARTRLAKHSLAAMAIEAAVEAIEKNDYRLVVPIEFEVAHIPVKKISYTSSARPAPPELNESRDAKPATPPSSETTPAGKALAGTVNRRVGKQTPPAK